MKRSCPWSRANAPHSGVLAPGASLVPSAVLEARIAYAAGGVSQAELGHRLRIGQNAMSRLLRGESWAHVGGPLKPLGRGRPKRPRSPNDSAPGSHSGGANNPND